MAERDNGPSLEELARRLEALERENERMRSESERISSENTELREELAALRGSGARRGEVAEMRSSDTRRNGEVASEFEGQVSRRSLLSKAGAAAVAAVAAGTLIHPRQANANHSNQIVEAFHVYTHSLRVSPNGIISTMNIDNRGAVEGTNNNSLGFGLKGTSSGIGVRGSGGTGVRGEGVIGVWGKSSTAGQAGVYAEHPDTNGPGVVGDGRGSSYAGVWGRNPSGTGVRGEGSTQAEVAGVRGIGKTGMWGSSATSGYSGVYGQHTGSSGYGVVGDGKGAGSTGVLGRNPSGTGVRGESSTVGHAAVVGKHSNAGFESIGVLGDTLDGVGVKGIGKNGVIGESSKLDHAAVYGQHTGAAGYGVVGDGAGSTGGGVLGRNGVGYGGRFEGGKAQLMLKPGGSAGKPTTGTHTKGEIYMDSAGTLFVCTAGDGTTVGTWSKVTTTAV